MTIKRSTCLLGVVLAIASGTNAAQNAGPAAGTTPTSRPAPPPAPSPASPAANNIGGTERGVPIPPRPDSSPPAATVSPAGRGGTTTIPCGPVNPDNPGGAQRGCTPPTK